MTIYTVVLADGTVGTIDSDTINGQHADDFIGDIVAVHLADENGNPMERRGLLEEVIEEKEPWE
jgi:hypothetical protein